VNLPPPEERRRIRRTAGYSQAETAQQLGVNPRTIHRWEKNISQPTPKHQRTYAELLSKWAQQN